MKKLLFIVLSFLLFSTSALKANEGMWLPMFIKTLNIADMQKMGLLLSADDLYSKTKPSLKDAIVGLSTGPTPQGYFCTAEIVSSQGLLFTNHHCGYNYIQKHSSVEHDYLKDGFWAMTLEEELPNEGMSASVLVYMADVTDSIIPQLNDTMSGSERSAAVSKIKSRLAKQASEDGKYNVVIKGFFAGNEYYMFVYQVYKDVRLVGAPPSAIGKFGGDTDNWMWPRHTGDFSIFRIYTAPDGSPAEYAEENVPLKPKHYLPISLDGVKKDDFAMIWGFPGTTERYLTSYGIRFKTEDYFPPLIEVFGKKLEIWKEHMDASQEVKIKYASNYAGIANAWKYFIGQDRGVKNLNVYDKKKAFEDSFTQWVNADNARKAKYGEALPLIDSAYAKMSQNFVPLVIGSVAGLSGADVMSMAQGLSGLEGKLKQLKEEKDKKKKEKIQKRINKSAGKLLESMPETYKDFDMATDKDVFAAMTELYYNKMPADMHPELLDKLVKKYKGNFSALADYVFANSFIPDSNNFKAFLADPRLKTLDKDPVYALMQGYMQYIMAASGSYSASQGDLKKGTRLWEAGIRAMQPDKKFYPDANSTLRFSYGKVLDYYPADAVHYDYVTHLKGVMEKEDPTNDEFIVPAKLKELYEKKDFGPYGEDGKLITDFLTTNDITGGNSGSPVMNAKGELIGLAFDGNWEAMSGDLAYEPELQRTICVDVRYVLFIIDKFAGDTRLIDELTIRKAMPQPSHVEQVEEVPVD
jgi:V8-like Glu-specific endopeptidase